MKISAGRIDAFLRAPGDEVRAVLIFGPDAGLVSERAATLLRVVAEDVHDPFRVAEVTPDALKDDPALLADEGAALSLTGGRRAVRLREAGDRQTAVLEDYLDRAQGDSVVIVEAADLKPGSSLRRLFEAADNAAALACYGDDPAALAEVIKETLAREGLAIETPARAYLMGRLGADRMTSRRELEKLVLYMARDEGRKITLDDILASVGDSAALSADDVAFAAVGGDMAMLDRALTRCFLAGNGPVPVLRATARHVQRLHLVSGLRDGGMSLDKAMKGLRPQVFFKREGAFSAQLGQWTTARLATALSILTEAEIACKSTGMPDEALCGYALMRIAGAARAGRRR